MSNRAQPLRVSNAEQRDMIATWRYNYAELEERHKSLQREYETLQAEHQRIRAGYSDALKRLYSTTGGVVGVSPHRNGRWSVNSSAS